MNGKTFDVGTRVQWVDQGIGKWVATVTGVEMINNVLYALIGRVNSIKLDLDQIRENIKVVQQPSLWRGQRDLKMRNE
jgi:hypothetical protein